ncbi:MAG: universal stress protein [Alphaproteobacteria bacterium]|nr:universal stress protein [Alphaproteobacteria bacterium]
MPIKSILAVLSGGPTDRISLNTAHAVAATFDSHIDALHAKGDPRDAIPVIGEGMSGPLVEEILQVAERDSNTRSQRAREAYDTWRKEHNVPVVDSPPPPGSISCAWREEQGSEEDVVTRRGRVTDLIVVARPADAKDLVTETVVEAVLFDTGRPVLVAPPEPPASMAQRVAIFWNGSVQVARAIGFAMPLLRRASHVEILTADEAKHAEASSDAGLVRHLGWHNVRAEVKRFRPAPRSTGEALLAQSYEGNADLLVMGAFTQSRLRQIILGGVTRKVLAEAKVPVLMAH